ncbi:unnamed protein product [Ilex paraguariensis]|uniref:Agmatine coumaroyltransferase-2-like n=1 Tax=Ilex paraguariensis TaxID=185542 RepID=A0ABC8SMH3_9AQUA
MNVRVESSRIIKPSYQGFPPPTTIHIPLSVFDKVTFVTHVALIYAYRSPNPPNITLELGLQKALSVYREWAGRFGEDNNGGPVILLNDEGMRFVETSVDSTLDQAMPLKPSESLLSLLPSLKGVVELVQVQFTRFTCGSLVLGFTTHHRVADGHFISNFLFLAKLKARTYLMNGANKPYNTFESHVAHLWRAITKARALSGFETTHIRIAVNGCTRLNPRVLDEYFGNLVLWIFPCAKVMNLLGEPLPYATKLIHDAVAKVNNNYFKSFIDFASYKVEEEDLITTTDADAPVLCPNLEVNCLIRLPFYDLDFGEGRPYISMPSYTPIEGFLFLQQIWDNLITLEQICYSIELFGPKI